MSGKADAPFASDVLGQIGDPFGTDTLQVPSMGDGPVTGASLEQLQAGADGAAAGLALPAYAASAAQGANGAGPAQGS